MDKNKRHFLIRFLEWDLTTVIAGTIALVVIVGFGFASAQPVVKFDFQGAAIDDINSGSTPVMGSLDLYPEQGPGDIVYGWSNTNIQEYSDQSVPNKLKRDSNSSLSNNIFKIAGLEAQKYTFRFVVGSSDIAMSTRIVFSSQVATSIVSGQGEWATKDVVYEVGEGENPLTLDFSSGDGVLSWGLAGLTIYATNEPIVPPSFDMTINPGSLSMFVGESANMLVGITPDEGYTYSIDFSVSGLPAGMKAEFTPTSLTQAPGSTTLKISLSEDISPTTYSVTLRAAGGLDDPEAVTKTTAFSITVKIPPEEEEEEDKVIKKDETDPTESERVAESISGFKLIGLYIDDVEDEQLVMDRDLNEIDSVVQEFAGFPVVDVPPMPVTSTESILQSLTALGIIDMVVSNAPPGRPAPKKPLNIWQKFVDAVFNQAG